MKKFNFKNISEIVEWSKTKDINGLSDYLRCLDVNINNMNAIDESEYEDEEVYRDNLYEKWEDPDSWTSKNVLGIRCTADGLHSCKRVTNGKSYNNIGLDEDGKYYVEKQNLISFLDCCRKVPIFFFPPARSDKQFGTPEEWLANWREEPVWHQGINGSRAQAYNDRIDLVLFDLKMWFEYQVGKITKLEILKICDPKMVDCYLDELTDTKKWIEKLNSAAKGKNYNSGFEYLVDEVYGVKGIFVNEEYEVYNLAYSSNMRAPELISIHNWDEIKNDGWSRVVFNNLKDKIYEFYAQQDLLID